MTKHISANNEPSPPSLRREKALPKTPTYIPGLDDVLHGGLPTKRITLVSGGPGSGKSIMGMEFLYHGATSGEPGIFVTFEERAEAVRQNALTLGWDLAALEKAGKFFLFGAHVDQQAALSGDFNVKGLLAIIEGKAKSMGASRIVIDAVDVLMRLFDNPARERNELYALHDWLNHREMTTVLTAKASAERDFASRFEFLDYMADCVIHFDQRVVEQVPTRRLRVIKYRGSSFTPSECPFVIAERGIHIMSISKVELQHKALGSKVSSGHSGLDAILDGGYRRASSILISGTSGTGKTTVANTFAASACKRGEKVLYLGFEESQEAMVSSMLSPGIDLSPALQSGKLRIMTAMPEARGAEEHLFRALKTIEAFQPDHVIVDAISSCKRMGTQQAAYEYVMRLANACKENGITIILTNQTEGFRDLHEISGVGISSVIDAVIFLRYIEVGGEINRMLLVMKARGQKHSSQYREFLITDRGIDIADVYVGEGGVLTGAARQEQEAKESFEARRKRLEIEGKEHHIKRKRAEMEAEIVARQAELEAAEAELKSLQLEESAIEQGRAVRAKMRAKGTSDARINTGARKGKRTGAGRREGAK